MNNTISALYITKQQQKMFKNYMLGNNFIFDKTRGESETAEKKIIL